MGSIIRKSELAYDLLAAKYESHALNGKKPDYSPSKTLAQISTQKIIEQLQDQSVLSNEKKLSRIMNDINTQKNEIQVQKEKLDGWRNNLKSTQLLDDMSYIGISDLCSESPSDDNSPVTSRNACHYNLRSRPNSCVDSNIICEESDNASVSNSSQKSSESMEVDRSLRQLSSNFLVASHKENLESPLSSLPQQPNNRVPSLEPSPAPNKRNMILNSISHPAISAPSETVKNQAPFPARSVHISSFVNSYEK